MDTCKIFVGGVSETTTEEMVRKFFSRFGKVGEIILPQMEKDGRWRGFSFVNFDSPESVDEVVGK